jgi:O-antigen ligase
MTAPPHYSAQILRFAAAVTPPLAVIAANGLAILLPVVVLAAAICDWRNGTLRRPPALPAVIVAAFLTWGAASALWAVNPRLVWSAWGQIAALAVAGVALLGIAQGFDADSRGRIGTALATGVIAAVALLALEWASSLLLPQSLGAMIYPRRSFNAFIFNRGAAMLAILVWPAAFAVRRRSGPRAAAVLVLATFVVVLQFESMAAILGIVGGGAIWCLAAWRPRLAGALLALGLGIGTACLPLVLRLPLVADLAARADGAISVAHRLQIWHFTAGAIMERPVAGWGLNASRALPGGREEFAPGARRLPLHPHNAVLQWWVELGAVGAALAASLGLAAIQGAARLRSAGGMPIQAAAFALFASGMLIASVGYGIWQSWWMAGLWLAAGLMAATGAPTRLDDADGTGAPPYRAGA